MQITPLPVYTQRARENGSMVPCLVCTDHHTVCSVCTCTMQYRNNAIFNLVQLLQFHCYFGKKYGRIKLIDFVRSLIGLDECENARENYVTDTSYPLNLY